MTYQEWMRQTGRGVLTPRSQKLKAVDAALQQFLAAPQSSGRLAHLSQSLEAWKRWKGANWTRSTRNSNGAVEDLDSWLRELTSQRGRIQVAVANVVDQHRQRLAARPHDVASAAAWQARRRQERQNLAEHRVSKEVTQTIAGDPQFGDQKFTWTVNLGLVQRGTVVEAKVRILAQIGGNPLGREIQSQWRTHIQTAWNIATIVDEEGGRRRYYDLVYDLEWVSADDPRPHYVINVTNPPPDPQRQRATTRQYRDHYRNQWMASHPGQTPDIETLNRFRRDANAQWSGGASQGFRANMGDWFLTDRQAIIHEFGHMIGNPDEYLCTSHRGFGHVYEPGIYNNQPFTTGSIMNNTKAAGRIHARHFRMVQAQYRIWKKCGAEIKILRRIGPTAAQETQQLLHASLSSRRQMMGYDDD